MTLLQLVQEFCRRRALPIPTYVMSNPDPGVLQIFGILNEFLEDLQTRKAWQRNIFETTFTSVAAEDQGDITTLCPYGFEEILWESIFDRTQRLPLFGSVSPSEWQARKAFNITGPYYLFRLRQNRLLFTPALPVDHTIAFEYNGSYFVKDTTEVPPAATAFKQYWAADTDTCSLGDALPLTYLTWKWAYKKGFDYAEDFAVYERLMAVKGARDARPQAVNLGSVNRDMRPGIFVPEGNWLQP
jgi:hypothetical protein